MRSTANTLGLLFLGALTALTGSGVIQIHRALAAPTSITYTVTTGSTALETIACNAGTSPCTIGTGSTTVLNANANRMQCLLQNANTTDFYCIQGTGTASTTNMHFVLKAASAANKGDGGTDTCNQGPATWRGAVVCAGSAASGTLNASAASAAGY